MSDVGLVFAILAGTIGLFVWNRLPAVVVAMGSALALHLSGVLSLPAALAGFGDPVVVFVASLFVVTAGLEATGVMAWAGQGFERLVAGSRERLQLVGMLGCAALCPFVNASGAVGALLPLVMLLVVRLGDSPARVLMPLAFASGAGSHLALTGAPKNVLISNAAAGAGVGPLNFFEFALLGLPLLAGTLVIVLLFADRLLPRREAQNLPPDLSRYAETLVAQYRLATDVFRFKLKPGAAAIGRPATALDYGAPGALRFITALGPDQTPRLGGPLSAGDMIVARGTAEAARAFAAAHGLKVEAISGETTAAKLINRMSGVVEAVIPPRSHFIGRRVFPGMLADRQDLVIVAVQRRGEDVPGETALEAGDVVLLQGAWDTIVRGKDDPGVLLVARPGEVKRQVVPFGVGARTMLSILGLMVVGIAGGYVQPAVAALLAAGATLALRIVTPDEAFRAVNWTTVVLMAAMFPLSTALYQTGAAQLVADALVQAVGSGAPRVLLLGVFALGVGLGLVISNTATCLILIPIAVLSAEAFEISPLPVLMTLSVATSASFLTPVSTPANTLVMGPAGYRFGDYWRLGLPLTLWYGVVAVGLAPLIWPF